MTAAEKDHYSPDRSHWCIVSTVNGTPFYYTGYFGKDFGSEIMKPAISVDFNKALKLHSEIAAEMVLNGLKSCSGVEGFIIQGHKWM